MNKVGTELIKIDKIKHVSNSRVLQKDDVADLMNDIKQNGLLQNIGIRIEDNAIIYGNRRLKAMKNLGYDKVMVDFFEDVSDDDLMIMNLSENLKRKNISCIEIGRICQTLLENGMHKNEIAAKLSISISRVSSCLLTYEITKGTPFEDVVMFGNTGASKKGIPETLLTQIQTNLSRAFPRRIISKSNWMILLKACESGDLNGKNITALRGLLVFNNCDVKRALEALKDTKIIYANLVVNSDEFIKEKAKSKIDSDVEMVKKIIANYNPRLLF